MRNGRRHLTPEPSEAQQRVLDELRAFIGEHDYSPTLRELALRLKLHHAGVSDHLAVLRSKGYVSWDDNKPRTLRPISRAGGGQVENA